MSRLTTVHSIYISYSSLHEDKQSIWWNNFFCPNLSHFCLCLCPWTNCSSEKLLAPSSTCLLNIRFLYNLTTTANTCCVECNWITVYFSGIMRIFCYVSEVPHTLILAISNIVFKFSLQIHINYPILQCLLSTYSIQVTVLLNFLWL